ncbi:hypothetical protein V3564_05180 [Bartonella sp. B12(2025)]
MLFFPFSIAEIDDPEHIRVVLYVNGKMGHVPLNALLKQISQDIRRFNKKQTQDITTISQRIDTLEQQLKTILQNLENVKHN